MGVFKVALVLEKGLRTRVFEQASGSAYFEAGNIKVVCRVNGPRADRRAGTERGRVYFDVRLATFSNPRKRVACWGTDPELSATVASAIAPSVICSAFPKSGVDVSVLVLEADGPVTALAAASITAASLALADATIPLVDLTAASSAGLLQGNVLMDMTQRESELAEAHGKGVGTMLVALMPRLNQVTQLVQTGDFNSETSSQCMEMCFDACAELYAAMRECLFETTTGTKTDDNKI